MSLVLAALDEPLDSREEPLILGTAAHGESEVAAERIRRTESARDDTGAEQSFGGFLGGGLISDANEQEVADTWSGFPAPTPQLGSQPVALR